MMTGLDFQQDVLGSNALGGFTLCFTGQHTRCWPSFLDIATPTSCTPDKPRGNEINGTTTTKLAVLAISFYC